MYVLKQLFSEYGVTAPNELIFQIEYFLCSDLKFLAMVCGIESATAIYSCVWCKCPSIQRYDMSKQ